MIAIIDYGVGNLFSIKSSFEAVGADTVVTSDPETIRTADKIMLPGVGAFEDAARKLKESGLGEIVKEEAAKGKPLLGVCLGMQLLFERSHEYGLHEGLGILKGDVVPMKGYIDEKLKVPQIGWNALKFTKESPLFKYIKEGDFVYFVHSFYVPDCAEAIARTTYGGVTYASALRRGNFYATQFHPEKSGDVGLRILHNFIHLCHD